jgi:hypothetical protein
MLMRVSASLSEIQRKRPPDVFGRSGAISAGVLLGNPRADLTRGVLSELASVHGSMLTDSLVPKKGLGYRAKCFQSLTVVLRPSHS